MFEIFLPQICLKTAPVKAAEFVGVKNILKGKATFKTSCLDSIVALPYFQNILAKRLTMSPI